MEKEFKIGDLVRLQLSPMASRTRYGVIIEIGDKIPPTGTWDVKKRSSPYISVMWVGKDHKHTIYKRFLKTMWERVEVIANA
tara:strand:- start:420 stop:665 length:246 start_codon:yes stop_codon:yes gene_type:complete